ncbi:hypothetical protein [Amycolatopsis magusensis]|uniref:hypothetical protein n=1 Tax=Amycolatopsis magusensis TaxID=882444 RepID=UPI003C2C6CFD
MTREFVAQGEPDRSLNWADFPRAEIRSRKTVLYRAARNGRGAWWFCACGRCRFDLAAPRGTCYSSTDRLCGLLECIGMSWCTGPLPVLEISFLQQWTIHAHDVQFTLRLANLTHRGAMGFRITNELSCMPGYELPQQYARLFDDTRGRRGARRFHGVKYRCRFDPGSHAHGVALFGGSGEIDWPSEEMQVDGGVIDGLRKIGIKVEYPPPLAALDLSDGSDLLDHLKTG